ncbi:hypothetical protein EVAR_24539_1 [Eumeta japonica]|uniref:Uncharacterized protein n=1 Tax=Eumeta variegata TaxID=151549 RepID=A0A4C1UQW1_EUMVA|nr:hypothetical protein EVAR_24539_1 [Eumeta japonica]
MTIFLTPDSDRGPAFDSEPVLGLRHYGDGRAGALADVWPRPSRNHRRPHRPAIYPTATLMDTPPRLGGVVWTSGPLSPGARELSQEVLPAAVHLRRVATTRVREPCAAAAPARVFIFYSLNRIQL